MNRKSSGAHHFILATLSLAPPLEAPAQTREKPPPGVYSPNGALQTPPLRVEILDGVRFRDIETNLNYRLYGVETCAPAQSAFLGRQPWPCGIVAAAWLVTATLNKWVACNTLRQEGRERLARCASADHRDIAADMIREGVGVMLPITPDNPGVAAYVLADREARKGFRGLWGSTFQMPWEFRAQGDRRANAKTNGEGAP